MKKLIKYGVIVLLFLLLLSCLPFRNNIVGAFLEVTVSGKYYNELTGELTDSSEELIAIVNLYELNKPATKIQAGGHFTDSGGIIQSSNSGFDVNSPTVSGTGTAHVNGFIAKGPFEEGSIVSIALINEDMSRVEIDPEFIDQLETETNDVSEFSLDLPATKTVDIKININSLTFLQTERMYELIDKEGLSFYEAYLQSKNEILTIMNITNGSADVVDFEKMDIREDNESNQVLLLANSILAGTEPVSKQGGSLLQEVLQQIKEHGAIIDENIGDKFEEKMANLDINQIIQNLKDFFGSSVNIPNPQQFMDDDNDCIVNRFDIELHNPVGQILVGDPANPPDNSFTWTRIDPPDDPTHFLKYRLQLSANPYFNPQYTATVDIPDMGSGSTITFDQIDVSSFTMDEVYFWRISPVIVIYEGVDDYTEVEKGWSASSSFIPKSYLDASIPIGTISALNGVNLPTRQIIIDNTQIIGASTMSFNVVGHPELSITNEDFELYRRILLPEGSGSGADSYTIQATFSNSTGNSATQSINVNIDTTQNPNGSFIINEDASETINTEVLLDLSNISYAYKMRFSNDGTNYSNWVPFRTKISWELDDISGNRTVYAQFANSGYYPDTNDYITDTIIMVDTNIINLTVSNEFRVIVGHDIDTSNNTTGYNFDNSDVYKLYLPTSIYNDTPHEIRFKGGTTVYFKVFQNNTTPSTPSWTSSIATPTQIGTTDVYYLDTPTGQDITLNLSAQ